VLIVRSWQIQSRRARLNRSRGSRRLRRVPSSCEPADLRRGRDRAGAVACRSSDGCAGLEPRTSQPDILLALTLSGQRKFLGLTTNVSRAGRQRHRPLHILISVNGRVISKPYIGYQGSPNRLPYKGILVDVASIRAAHDLAARPERWRSRDTPRSGASRPSRSAWSPTDQGWRRPTTPLGLRRPECARAPSRAA
jgi:hypothetical protein